MREKEKGTGVLSGMIGGERERRIGHRVTGVRLSHIGASVNCLARVPAQNGPKCA